MCAGERVAFVCVLCDHTASAEWEGSASGFGTTSGSGVDGELRVLMRVLRVVAMAL